MLIIGGGVIGLSCAWRLAQRGCRVTVLERGQCGSGATLASLGALYPPPPSRRKPLQHLHRLGLQNFPAFAEEIEEISSVLIDYRRRGRFEALFDATQRDQARHDAALADREWTAWHRPPVMEVLSPAAARQLEPNLLVPESGALLCHVTAQVNPARMLLALRRASARAGVKIQENTPAMELVLERSHVQGVRTANAFLPAATVLVAAGAWSSHLHPRLKQYAQVLPLKGQAMLLGVNRPLFSRLIKYGPFYLIRKSDREVLLGATTEPEAGYDDRVTETAQQNLRLSAIRFLPALADAEVIRGWAGIRPAAARRKPCLGAVPETDGLYVAAGHGKIGIALAPKTGAWLAQLITEGETSEDISTLRP